MGERPHVTAVSVYATYAPYASHWLARNTRLCALCASVANQTCTMPANSKSRQGYPPPPYTYRIDTLTKSAAFYGYFMGTLWTSCGHCLST